MCLTITTMAPVKKVSSEDIGDLNHSISKCIRQVKVLNQEMSRLECRYAHAVRHQKATFRYTLRLRISTFEDVRNHILTYAQEKAVKIHNIRNEINQK